MIVIPNLFGAYQKGREAAIDANWKDLRNYEDIEAARTRNDLDALTLLGKQADFGYDRENARFVYNDNYRKNELGELGHAGNLYSTTTNNILSEIGYNVVDGAARDGRLFRGADARLDTWVHGSEHAANVAQSNSINSGINLGVLQKNIDALTKTRNELFVRGLDTSRLDAEIAYYRSLVAQAYSGGQAKNLDFFRQAGQSDAEAQAIASKTSVVSGQNALYTAQENLNDAPKNRASALNARITAVVNNINTAMVQNNPEAYAVAVREYENLTGKKYDGRPFGVVATSVTPASGSALFNGGGQVGVNTVLAPTTNTGATPAQNGGGAKSTQKPQTPAATQKPQTPTLAQRVTYIGTPNGAPLFHPSLAGKQIGNKVYFTTPAMYSSPVGQRAVINPTANWASVGYGSQWR